MRPPRPGRPPAPEALYLAALEFSNIPLPYRIRLRRPEEPVNLDEGHAEGDCQRASVRLDIKSNAHSLPSTAERTHAFLDSVRKNQTFRRHPMISTKETLAIDLGKFNSVICCFDSETKNAEFRTIPTSTDLLREALFLKPDSTVLGRPVPSWIQIPNRWEQGHERTPWRKVGIGV